VHAEDDGNEHIFTRTIWCMFASNTRVLEYAVQEDDEENGVVVRHARAHESKVGHPGNLHHLGPLVEIDRLEGSIEEVHFWTQKPSEHKLCSRATCGLDTPISNPRRTWTSTRPAEIAFPSDPSIASEQIPKLALARRHWGRKQYPVLQHIGFLPLRILLAVQDYPRNVVMQSVKDPWAFQAPTSRGTLLRWAAHEDDASQTATEVSGSSKPRSIVASDVAVGD
jgi:hypothetical protein